ncbi:MAG TPA: RNA chaperone Hfq [Clostridiales bacterium]|nr:RNA chaperone Hfq [Clostridiales bacterium]
MQKNLALQDTFLNQARKDDVGVTVHLINGFQIKGRIKGFDSFIIVLETDSRQQMIVYKHAVSTITPVKTVALDVSLAKHEEAGIRF